MKVGSVFAGIGGFDLGLERAGMQICWQIEIDPACQKVLSKHWPKVKRYGDVRTVNTTDLEPVDLLCGGFPCQDISIAGSRAGIFGTQSSLYWEFHRLASALRPRWILIENVPELLSSHRGFDFRIIIESLVELGYGVAWRVLNAEHFGLPQRRKRVYIVGHLGKPWSASLQVLHEPESLCGCASGGGGTEQADSTVSSSRSRRRSKEWLEDESLIYPHERPVVFHWQSRGTKMWLGINEKPGAIYASAIPAILYKTMLRKLTPLEYERLQGFPDGWTEVVGSKRVRYRLVANAVPVPVIEWIGRRIMSLEEHSVAVH